MLSYFHPRGWGFVCLVLRLDAFFGEKGIGKPQKKIPLGWSGISNTRTVQIGLAPDQKFKPYRIFLEFYGKIKGPTGIMPLLCRSKKVLWYSQPE